MTYKILTEVSLLNSIAEQSLPFLVISFLILSVAGLVFHGYLVKHSYHDMEVVKEGLRSGTRGYVYAHLIAAQYHLSNARIRLLAQVVLTIIGVIGALTERPRTDDVVFIIHLSFVVIVALILYSGIMDNIERKRLLEQSLEEVDSEPVTDE